MDFDLATVTPNMENVPIRQCCSLRWSAPEVLRGKAGIGKEADIYSLGMVIIEVWIIELYPSAVLIMVKGAQWGYPISR